MNIRHIILLLTFIPLSSSNQVFAQEIYEDTRPKVGLVLSGGGAKGLAHIGVIKVLEEAGIRPDYITGTSMGSIVGGLYSIGYSADELAHILETVDWGRVLTNEIPASQVIMSRKDDYSKFSLEMPVYKGRPELPSGLIKGQKISELFSDFTWRPELCHACQHGHSKCIYSGYSGYKLCSGGRRSVA